jgi:hypothetical protein
MKIDVQPSDLLTIIDFGHPSSSFSLKTRFQRLDSVSLGKSLLSWALSTANLYLWTPESTPDGVYKPNTT